MAWRPGPLEEDTCRDVIRPLVSTSGWTDEQVVEQFAVKASAVATVGGQLRRFGDGFVDYVLRVSDTPVAVVEAKRAYRSATDGLQQALRYAQQLDVPLAYASNGNETIEHNLRTGAERTVTTMAAPAVAWDEYQKHHGLDLAAAQLLAQPFNRRRHSATGEVITPRYYQAVAINRVLAAIGRGERRVLLLMATGTGKTFTAMQVVAKLRSYEAKVRPGHNYRVLFLADRDQLLSQPMRKDFTPAFGSALLNRVLGGVDRSREIYFATYQALSGGGANAELFQRFRPDFFDLVIVDEAHRGSADANSAWRGVLDYFAGAVHLGLTATPRSDEVNSYEYFGNPVFEYSLRQGIEDGFLAPYRVRRVALTPDADGWRPAPGQVDRFRREIPDGIYTTRDFERVVSLLVRTQVAARHLSGILRQDPTARCIVFCVDVEHADEMRRALVAENPDLVAADPEWVVRIVGVEGEKERLLDDFTDPERTSPVVATTSRLLSTGVDVEDLKFVVLFRPVGSAIEFKQIIGRGTRLYPDKGKTFFEIVDYVGASAHFEDPDFDGYPAHIIVEEVGPTGEVTESVDVPTGEMPMPPIPPEVNEPTPGFEAHNPPDAPPPAPPRRKFLVDEGDFRVEAEAALVADTSSGQLVLTEYGAWVRERIVAMGDRDEIERRWAQAPTRHELLAILLADGIDVDDLVEEAGLQDADPLDALLSLAWNLPVRTRAERVRRVRERHAGEMERLSERARGVLEGLLQRYETHGVRDLESGEVFRLPPLRELGTPIELARAWGGATELSRQLDRVQGWLYSA